MGEVHDLHGLSRQRDSKEERDKKRRMIEVLERRQDERRLFLAEIENLIERRQRQIDIIKRQLEEDEARDG